MTGLCLAHANCVVGVFETKCPNALDLRRTREDTGSRTRNVGYCVHGGLSVAELHGKSFPESLEKPDNFELSDDLMT